MKYLKKYSKLIVLLLTLIELGLFFLHCSYVSFNGGKHYQVSMYQMIFSYSLNNTKILTFNIVGFIMLLLIILNPLIILFDKQLDKIIYNSAYSLSALFGYASTLLILMMPLIVNNISSHISYNFIGSNILYICAFINLVNANMGMFLIYTKEKNV